MNRKLHTEDIFVVRKMIDGDHEAFKYFFDKYYSDLCNFVNIYLKNQILAEEVVQDIFVYFWENRSRLTINSSVRSYLFAASKYKSLNIIRDEKRHSKALEDLGSGDESWAEMQNNSIPDHHELREIIDNAITGLPKRCKEIFLLSKEKDLNNKDIAQQLNVSVKTVENQMTIALKKLRASLLPYRDKLFLILLIEILSK